LIKVFLIVLLLLSFKIAIAQDGYALFSSCQNVKYLQEQVIDTHTSAFEAGYCIGIIYGVYATLTKINSQRKICLPVLGLSNQEKIEIVTNHLKLNNEHLKKEDILLIMDAFKTSFPCPGSK
jgi:hypothetical protein